MYVTKCQIWKGLIFLDNSLIYCTPEEVGITSASFLNFIDLARDRNINIHSLLVMRHGKIAAELYWNPYCAEEAHHLYSVSKSFTATAVGFAIAEGLLSPEDRVASFFPRKIHRGCDDRIYSVTVEHLLTMSAGIVSANEVTMLNHVDWIKWFLNSPLEFFPGDKFSYNSLDTYILSAILRKVTGMGLVDYLMPRLFEPLGIERPLWLTCPMGIECGGWGLHLKTTDIAKFVRLYLDRGIWNGKRILPEEWIDSALSIHADPGSDQKFLEHPDTKAGYGYCFWRGRDNSWRADGMFGQYGIMLPDSDTVIVTTSASPNQMLVLDLLWDTIVPAIDSIPENSEPGEDNIALIEAAAKLSVSRIESVQCADGLCDTINGKKFIFAQNTQSMMPFLVRSLYKIPWLGIDNVQFDFPGDGSLAFSWSESYCRNSFSLIIGGADIVCDLTFGGTVLKSVVSADWTSERTLTIDIRPINTPHNARISFEFDGDRVTYSYDEDPPFDTSLKMFFDLAQVMRPLSGQLSKIAGGLIPSITGIVEIDTENEF